MGIGPHSWKGYPLDNLDYLHTVVPQPEVFKVTKQLCADTNLPEFRRMLNRFVREVVVPTGKLRLPVAVQRFMNVRIMLPTTPDLFFPVHTGLLYGHGIASRSLWLPFVDVTADEDRSRSMQIIGIKRSRELIRHAIDKRLSMEAMTEIFGAESHQNQGQTRQHVLFHPGEHPRLGPAQGHRQDARQHGFPYRRGHLWRSAGSQDPSRPTDCIGRRRAPMHRNR